MRSVILTLLLLAIASSSLKAEQIQSRSAVQVTNSDSESPVNGERIKRLRIRDQAGLDGKVHGIRLDSEEDKPGIYAYGLSRKRLQDNGIIEITHVAGSRASDDSPRNSRLVEAYGMPKDNVENNGVIQRVPSLMIPAGHLHTSEAGNEEIREKRSIREENGNKIEEKVASEAEDMEAQDSKVFRPLFVYRQQVARRQNRNHKNSHLYHRHHVYRHRSVY